MAGMAIGGAYMVFFEISLGERIPHLIDFIDVGSQIAI
jgi:hypothetical protein